MKQLANILIVITFLLFSTPVKGLENSTDLTGGNDTVANNETTRITDNSTQNKDLNIDQDRIIPINETSTTADQNVTLPSTEKNVNETFRTNANKTQRSENCPDSNFNEYVDSLLDNVRNNISDRIPLPDQSGFFTYTDGYAWGLSTMKRVGDAKMECTDNSITLESVLRFEELKARYKWERDTILRTFSGVIFVKADQTDILFRVKREGTRAYLEKFDIIEMTGIDTEITGLSYITWTLSRLSDPVVNLFRRTIANIVEGPLREAVSSEIEDMNLPF